MQLPSALWPCCAQSHLRQVYLMTNCCRPCLTLWLGGSEGIQLTMSSFGCVVNLMMRGQTICLYQNPVANQELYFVFCLFVWGFFFWNFILFIFWLRWVFIAGFSLVVARGFSWPVACGTLVPRPGIEPMSSALEGRLLTNGPPGKSLGAVFWKVCHSWLQMTWPCSRTPGV